MKQTPLVLGVHPSSRGFGWVLAETPRSLLDWGGSDIREDHNPRAISQLIKLLEKHKPEILVLEAFDDAVSRRKERIRRLGRAFVSEADLRGLPSHIMTRAQIRQVFGGSGTRQQVAEAVATRIPALASFLPEPRKIWVGEHANMAVFAAAACAIASYEQ